jgi:hypothetical protein
MTDKQIIIDYKNLCENYSKKVGCYGTFDGSCIKEQCFTYKLLQKLKAKEQECEELKEYKEDLTQRLCDMNAHKTFEIVELKQTLSEIKEIAERGLNCSQCSCGAKADLDLILQKINEVENV